MARKKTVSVIGSGGLSPRDPRGALAYEFGKALVDHGYVVVCGGLGGVMEAAAKGARASEHHRPGSVIGVLPGDTAANANPYLDIALPTGLGHLRNSIVARSDAVVAVGGGAGTLSEMALAWIFDRVVLAYRVGGWSGEMADRPIDGRRRFPDNPEDRVYGVDAAEEVISLLARLL